METALGMSGIGGIGVLLDEPLEILSLLCRTAKGSQRLCATEQGLGPQSAATRNEIGVELCQSSARGTSSEQQAPK
jgi:hypothetical protein